MSHLAHWANLHGGLLAAGIVTGLATGSLLYAAWRNRRRRQAAIPVAPVVDASVLSNGELVALLDAEREE